MWRAFSSSREATPHAIVLDVFLRDQFGFAVCRAIRESPDAKTVPILAVTRSASDLDRILALEAGADDVVVRPFFPRELALRVRPDGAVRTPRVVDTHVKGIRRKLASAAWVLESLTASATGSPRCRRRSGKFACNSAGKGAFSRNRHGIVI